MPWSRLALAVFGERARGTPRHGPVLRRSFKEKGDVGFGHRRATGSGGVRRMRQESASLCRVMIKKGGVGFGSRRTMGSAGSWERARRAPRSAARSRRIALCRSDQLINTARCEAVTIDLIPSGVKIKNPPHTPSLFTSRHQWVDSGSWLLARR